MRFGRRPKGVPRGADPRSEPGLYSSRNRNLAARIQTAWNRAKDAPGYDGRLDGQRREAVARVAARGGRERRHEWVDRVSEVVWRGSSSRPRVAVVVEVAGELRAGRREEPHLPD